MEQVVEQWDADIKEWRRDFEEEWKVPKCYREIEMKLLINRGYKEKEAKTYAKSYMLWEGALHTIPDIDGTKTCAKIKEGVDENVDYNIMHKRTSSYKNREKVIQEEYKRRSTICGQINWHYKRFEAFKENIEWLHSRECKLSPEEIIFEHKSTISDLKEDKQALKNLSWHAKAYGINLPKIAPETYKKWKEMLTWEYKPSQVKSARK